MDSESNGERSSPANPEGVVAAIGVRYGQHLRGIRALLERGFSVCAFDLGSAIDDMPLGEYDEDLERQVRELLSRWPDRFAFVDRIGHDQVTDVLANARKGAARVLALTDERFGATDLVYMGSWWGVVDDRMGAQFIKALASRGRGEFVATEENNPFADHTLRWVAHWAAQLAGGRVTCAVLREPTTSNVQLRARPTPNSSHACRALAAAGWSSPLSVEAADAIAARRVADGNDVLAGRRWRFVRTGDVDSGRVAVGDAAEIERASDAEPGLPDSPAHNRRWAKRPGYVVFAMPGGDWPYGVAVTSPEGKRVDAVRLELAAGAASEFSDQYEEVATIEIPSGQLLITDPAYMGEGYPPAASMALRVRPGTWVVDRMTHGREPECVRLRPAPSDAVISRRRPITGRLGVTSDS